MATSILAQEIISIADKPEIATLQSAVPEANPWDEQVQPHKPAPITVPFEPETINRTPSPSPLPRLNQGDVLTEFDPLANKEEHDAREAWAESEGHPPPPRTPSPEPIPTPQAASHSPFPSLAAFARNFSIPSLPRGRPLSLDTATAVPSPSTLSSFAEQQQKHPPKPQESSNLARTGSESATGAVTPDRDPRAKDKEPAFDFQKFLDQMKTKSAEPIAKYLRSFLSNFAKRTFTVNDQVKIINDFLNFIATRMRETDIWKKNTEGEFDNAMEGMEKLVMNRLYEFTFTPQVALAEPRRPVTADDLERDRVLTQRVALFGWVEGQHLDIPEGEGSTGFLMFAQQELLKINHYKAPRDKLICILNTCKVIFGLIRHMRKEEGADSFLPILIFIVLKANPDHLLSNVEFIQRFRNPLKLQSEAGYYLSSLMGAVSFIETMDHTSLSNITQEQFEKNVEAAIQALPPDDSPAAKVTSSDYFAQVPPPSPHAGEESAEPLALTSPNPLEDARRLLQKTGDTISKPLNAIGRIFSEALDGAESKLPTYLPGPFAPFEIGRENRHEAAAAGGSSTPNWAAQSPGEAIQTPYKQRVRRIPSPSISPGSPGYFNQHQEEGRAVPYTNPPLTINPSLSIPRLHALARPESDLTQGGAGLSRTPTPNLDIPALQAQIDSAHVQAAEASQDTLFQIFPSVDREVAEWVLEANGGDLGKSIEQLLEMSTGS